MQANDKSHEGTRDRREEGRREGERWRERMRKRKVKVKDEGMMTAAGIRRQKQRVTRKMLRSLQLPSVVLQSGVPIGLPPTIIVPSHLESYSHIPMAAIVDMYRTMRKQAK